MTELFKSESEVTEDDWREYFLAARVGDHTDYTKLDRAGIDLTLNNVGSRLSRLMVDFYAMLDTHKMEPLLDENPKRAVGYLLEALRPGAVKEGSEGRDAEPKPQGYHSQECIAFSAVGQAAHRAHAVS